MFVIMLDTLLNYAPRRNKQTMSTDASVLQVQVRSNCNALEVQVGSDSSQVAQ